jgi:DsbC/DsbD-like thiol-disulfide interchange protein
MRQGHFVGLFAILIACSLLLAAKPPAEHPAKADLTSIQPGQPFQIALRVQMPKDWHIYWIDPGDSGTATEFTFKGPDGWKIEPLTFPTPHKFTLPGDIVNNGYEGTVLFLAKVTPPPDAKGEAAFSVDAEWLVCNPEMCIPGSGSAKLTLEVGTAASPANMELFKKWQEQIPTPIKTPDVDPASQNAEHTIHVPFESSVKNVDAFLAPGRGFVVKDVKVVPQDKQVTITFKSQTVGKEKKPADMVVLVAYEDAGGVRRGVQMTYPLKP